MKLLIYTCHRLAIIFALSAVSIACSQTSYGNTPEIIVWPHQEKDQLFVARETTQPFYIMAYNRGQNIQAATEVEVAVPENWHVWQGSQAPPAQGASAEAKTIKMPLKLRTTKDTVASKDYSSANSAGNLLMVARPLAQATEGQLTLRWLKEGEELAKREVSLNPIALPFKATSPGQNMIAGMWLNNPKFHDETMAQVYSGLRRSGIDYVIITREMYRQSKAALQELGIKTIVGQWWDFHEYVPGTAPEAAYSTLKDGSIDRTRWSPTYMAEGGPEFIKQVEAVADELKQMDGVYGFMLDYEPGAKGIDADYGAQSRQVFEKHLGRPVAAWPADVLTSGKDEEAWINFRNDQSEAYVRWFHKIIKERAPQVKLSVSTSGATLKPDDINRRLAVTDITQLSRASDFVHPQLYSWTAKLPEQLARFNDKLKLGQTTIAAAKAPVYTAVGSMVGKAALSNPEYLRTQILNWWFRGARGFEIWQYFYGVDGRYMAMTNELAHLFETAGDKPQSSPTANSILTAQPSDALEIISRTAADGKTTWVGLFNFSAKPVKVPLTTKKGWQLSQGEPDTVTIAPWSTHVAVCLPSNQ